MGLFRNNIIFRLLMSDMSRCGQLSCKPAAAGSISGYLDEALNHGHVAIWTCPRLNVSNQTKMQRVLYNFSLSVKAVTLTFISGRGLAISSAKQGKSGSMYTLVKNE